MCWERRWVGVKERSGGGEWGVWWIERRGRERGHGEGGRGRGTWGRERGGGRMG